MEVLGSSHWYTSLKDTGFIIIHYIINGILISSARAICDNHLATMTSYRQSNSCTQSCLTRARLEFSGGWISGNCYMHTNYFYPKRLTKLIKKKSNFTSSLYLWTRMKAHIHLSHWPKAKFSCFESLTEALTECKSKQVWFPSKSNPHTGNTGCSIYIIQNTQVGLYST